MLLEAKNRIIAGALLFVGSAQFAVLMIVAEAVYPSYSVSENFISDLGVWSKPSAVVFNPSILLFGLLTVVGAYYFYRASKLRGFCALLSLTGLGGLGVGVFPEDTFLVGGFPIFHGIFALLAFLSGALAAISSGHRAVKGPFRVLSIFLGIGSLLALVLFLVTASIGYLGLGVGGMERMITYPTLLWTVGFGGYLLTPSQNE